MGVLADGAGSVVGDIRTPPFPEVPSIQTFAQGRIRFQIARVPHVTAALAPLNDLMVGSIVLRSMEGTDRLDVYAELLAQLREPLMIATRDGQIRAANVATADALATSVKTLVGGFLAAYSPDPSGLAAKLRKPSDGWQVPLRGRDGRRFSCDASALTAELLLLRLSGGPELEPRARFLTQTLSRLSAMKPSDPVAGTRESLEDIARPLLARGVTSLGAQAAGIFLIDETGTNLELVAAAFYPENYADRFRLIPLTADLPLARAATESRPIFLESIEDYRESFPSFASAHPTIATSGFAAAPLTIEGSVVGALCIGFDGRATFGPDERALVLSLAERSAEVARLVRAADGSHARPSILPEAASQRLERLHALTGALAQAHTPGHVIEAVVDMGMATTSAISGGLWLLSEDRTVSLARSVGFHAPRSENFQNISIDRASPMPILDAIRTGAPVWIESCRQLEERYPDLFRSFQSHAVEASLACLPLFAQGRCIGGLVYAFDGVHRFLEDERAFLQVIAWYSAQAIERARLYAEIVSAKDHAEESRQRSEFLADIGKILGSSLDSADILHDVARATVPRIADWCIIELASQRSPAACHVDPSKVPLLLEMREHFRALGDVGLGIASVSKTGTSQWHPTITLDLVRERLGVDPTLVELIENVGSASAIVVPISARGTTLGAIVLNRFQPDRPYGAHDLAIAEELGRRVGLAIDNRRLYQEAREADQLKDEFLAMLSHELRNPLAPILTALELMNLDGGSAFERERGMISRHVKQVVRLVDDLLDVSRITRGKIQLAKVRCELPAILASAVEMVTPHCDARRHRLSVTVEPELPVIADAARLAQAIANVLTNASKYTEPGGEITVSARAEGQEAVLRVRDTGIGIAPHLLPRVFDLFVQGEASLDRAQGGLGIGLTVVKSMVSMHGGSVTAWSEGIGQGSEFVLRLPIAPQETRIPERNPSTRPPRPTADRRRVLIVDDNHDAAALLGEAMQRLGWTIETVHDGPSALMAATTFQPQVVLLDIGLPIMDGYELARTLRRSHGDRPLRLIAVTGYGQESDRERSREAGFDEHVVKPVHLDTLRRVLEGAPAPSTTPPGARATDPLGVTLPQS